MCQKS